jgi:ABC-type transport system involved in cytochrome c biogenesis permease component
MGRIFRRSIWRGMPKMHERCAVCDLRFDREPGYFLGAMYISFVLGLAAVAVIAAVLWAVTGWWITKDILWAVVLFLPLAPGLTLFARVLWIYLDQTVDPDRG